MEEDGVTSLRRKVTNHAFTAIAALALVAAVVPLVGVTWYVIEKGAPGEKGAAGEKGDKGDKGDTASVGLRSVQADGSVSCEASETLVSVFCPGGGAPDGAKCATPLTVGLCLKKP